MDGPTTRMLLEQARRCWMRLSQAGLVDAPMRARADAAPAAHDRSRTHAAPRQRAPPTNGKFDSGSTRGAGAPTPWNTVSCFVAADGRFSNGGNCVPAGGVPGGNGRFLIGGKMFGYRDIDLALIKNFPTVAKMNWYVRLDVLNALNFHNLIDLNFVSDPMFTNTSATYNPTGNILGFPRTLKLTAGMRF